MYKFLVYRCLKGEKIDQHIRQHELIAVEFSEDEYEGTVWNSIYESIKCDMISESEHIYDEAFIHVDFFDPFGYRVKRYDWGAYALWTLKDSYSTILSKMYYGIKIVKCQN